MFKKEGLRNKKVNKLLIFLVAALLALSSVCAATFVDDTESEFNQGSYSNTGWNTDHVQLSAGQTSGTYASKVFDAGSSATWNDIAWTSSSMGELDNNQADDVLLLHLNEDSGNIIDYSGEGNDCSVSGATRGADGKLNKAVSFDGASDYLDCGNDSSLSLIATDFTISAWIYPTALSGIKGIVGNGASEANGGWSFWTYSSNNLLFYIGTTWAASNTNSVTTNQWQQVVVVFDDATNSGSFYVNGVNAGNFSSMANVGPSTHHAIVGLDPRDLIGYDFSGRMDEMTVYTKKLSLSEIQEIYKKGATRLNLTVRSCDDAGCSGESYNDVSDISPQTLSVPDNRFFQYNFLFGSDSSSFSPDLYNVTITINASGGAGNDTSSPGVVLISPTNGQTFTSTNNVTLTVSATDNLDLDNCTPYTDVAGTWQASETKTFTGTADSDTWNFYFLDNGTYAWNSFCCDNSSNCGWANTNSTFTVSYSQASNQSNQSNQTSGTITLTYPVQYVTFQRNGSNKASLWIEGTYTGSPTAIEAQFNNGGWQTLVASPSGGSFVANLTNQNVGQGKLEVRFANNVSVNASVSYIGIGDIYAIAGQSNAEMRGTNAQSLNSSNQYNATVYREDNAWTIANDPVDTGTSIGSSWPLLANHIIQKANIPVAFVSASTGGTSILSWQKGQSLYNNLVNQITEATNGSKIIKGVIWYQGENDVLTSGGCYGNYAWYKANLSQFANDLASNITMEKGVIVGQINYWTGGTRATSDNIKKAQQDLWDENSNISVGVTTYDISIADNVHYKSNAELQIFADRWWSALERLSYGGSCTRPRIQTASFDVATNKLTLTFNASAPIVNGSGTQGWRINDGTVNITDSGVLSASVTGNYTIQLTLNSTIHTGANLTLGSYSDCWGKNCLNFSCSTVIPPEMILAFPITISSLTMELVNPTPADGSTVNTSYLPANISMTETSAGLSEFKFNWNGTNHTFYDSNLVLMMNFDNVAALGENSTKAVDLSAYKNNATLLNGAAFSSVSKYGQALSFDGTDDYAQIPSNNVFNFGTKDFTIEAWIKTNSNTGQGIISKTDPSGYVDSSDGFAVFLTDSNLVRVRAQSLAISAASTETINTTDGWVHLTVVADRDQNVTIYKNGRNIGSANISTYSGTSITSSYDLKLGLVRATQDDYFNGSIDELKIYNRTLSPNEINQHYYANLYKYGASQWAFYTNQSNLTNGTYTGAAYAKEANATSYVSVSRNWTVAIVEIDTTAPAAVSNLNNQSAGSTWIYWNWTNPATDFSQAIVYLNGTNVANTSNNYYNATGLSALTSYIIQVNTKDASGNINTTNVNSTASTLAGPDLTAPIIQSTSPTNSSSLTAGTTSTTITLTTDEIAVCRYNTSSVAWGNMTQLTSTNSTSHSFTVTNLSDGSTYNHYFLCEDDETSPNRMSSSYNLQFSVASSSGSGSGSGGGGGSSAKKTTGNATACEEKWSCVAWSDCADGKQTRTCYEQNNCNTILLKPEESQVCGGATCQENWACLDWGPCENGNQIRICKDVNNCGTLLNKPQETQECETNQTLVQTIKGLASGTEITGKTVVNSLNLPNPQLLVPTMLLVFALFALFFLRKIQLSKHMKELVTVLYIGMAAIIVFLLSMTFVPSTLIPTGLFTSLGGTKELSIMAVLVFLGLSTIAYFGKIFIGHMRHPNKKKVKHG